MDLGIGIGTSLAVSSIISGAKNVWNHLTTQGCKIQIINDTRYVVRLSREEYERQDGTMVMKYSVYPEDLTRLQALDGRQILENQSVIEQFAPGSFVGKQMAYDLFMQYEIRRYEGDFYPVYLQVFIHMKRQFDPTAIVQLTSEFLKLEDVPDFLASCFESPKDTSPERSNSAKSSLKKRNNSKKGQDKIVEGSDDELENGGATPKKPNKVAETLGRTYRRLSTLHSQMIASAASKKKEGVQAVAAKLQLDTEVIKAELTHSTRAGKPLDIKVVLSRDLVYGAGPPNGSSPNSLDPGDPSDLSRRSSQTSLMSLPAKETESLVNKLRSDLASYYRTSFSTVELFDGCPILSVKDVFVNLDWQEQNGTLGSDCADEFGNFSHLKLIQRLLSDESNLLVINANPGKGKTTFVKKLCYDWTETFVVSSSGLCERASDNCLSSIKLLLTLCLRDVTTQLEYILDTRSNTGKMQDKRSVLSVIMSTYLSYQYSKDEVTRLTDWINRHPNEVLLVLDGYDEYLFRTDKDGPLYNGLHSKRPKPLPTKVILTSRPYTCAGIKCQHMEITIRGLQANQALVFVQNYCRRLGKEKCDRIVQEFKAVERLPSHAVIFDTPMLVLMWCTLAVEKETSAAEGEVTQALPHVRSALYNELCKFIYRRFLGREPDDSPYHAISKKWQSLPVVADLQKLAIEADDKVTFTISQLLSHNIAIGGPAFEIGFLVSDHQSSPGSAIRAASSFIHKSVQDYFAALYVANELLRHQASPGAIRKIRNTIFRGNISLSSPLQKFLQSLRADVSNHIDILWFVYDILEEARFDWSAFIQSDSSGLSKFANPYQIALLIASSDNYKQLGSSLMLDDASHFAATRELFQWELDQDGYACVIYGENVKIVRIPGLDAITASVCYNRDDKADLVLIDANRERMRYTTMLDSSKTSDISLGGVTSVGCLAIKGTLDNCLKTLATLPAALSAKECVISLSSAPGVTRQFELRKQPLGTDPTASEALKVIDCQRLALIANYAPAAQNRGKSGAVDLTALLTKFEFKSLKAFEVGRNASVVPSVIDGDKLLSALESATNLEELKLHGIKLHAEILQKLLSTANVQKSLSSVSLMNVDLSAAEARFLEAIQKLVGLRNLALIQAELSKEILSELPAKLSKKLQSLDLSGNSALSDLDLFGPLCNGLAKLSALQSISFRSCGLLDASMDCVGHLIENLGKLAKVDIRWNREISGAATEKVKAVIKKTGRAVEILFPKDR